MERIFPKSLGIIPAALAISVVVFALGQLGNPFNMGLCVVSFIGDIVGALGLHNNAFSSYIRPEIIGLFFGAFFSTRANASARPRAGASPITKFFLGICVAFGALVFMGDPLRAFVRLGAGDSNALVGVCGFLCGVAGGTFLLTRGLMLGKSRSQGRTPSLFLLLFFLLLLLFLLAPDMFSLKFSVAGAGSFHTAPFIGLGGGLLVGVLLHRSKFCCVAPLRQLLLLRDGRFFYALLAFMGAQLFLNLLFGTWGMLNQPLAHNNILWSFMAMLLVGLALTFAGGCPLRQFALASEGDGDAAMVLLGIFIGALLANRWDIVATQGVSVSSAGKLAVVVGLCFCLAIFFFKHRLAKVHRFANVCDLRDYSVPQSLQLLKKLLKNLKPLGRITVLLNSNADIEKEAEEMLLGRSYRFLYRGETLEVQLAEE
ncbi:MAG: YedE-related selenium metabolism membrane protein [Deltaproteobacteria bacterium]|nr:YedE-related selenium metabolism membrane protein [Deltaproteobacteria bacterium]